MASDGVIFGRGSGMKDVDSGVERGASASNHAGMAPSSASGPANPKVPSKTGSQWNRPSLGRYGWDSPSPSPAEVEELIRLFPDIIQVPVSSLENEVNAWGAKAVLARSLSRWVPPEAIVRELLRFGLPRDIEVVPLAHKHYLIRLPDSQSKSRLLERPWVINGQVLAVADWVPEFIPAEDSLLQALVWVRLPLLPLEFWADDILSSILSVAGEFLFSDESTRARQRGGFARACVRVDLGLPLRPGARVRGFGVPFWQQFSFENVEGICDRCASLHLTGPCLKVGERSSSPAAPTFGPWMAAVRRRRPPPVLTPVQSEGDRLPPGSSTVSKDGWSVPKKIARRRLPPSGSSVQASGTGAGRNESAIAESVEELTRELGVQLPAEGASLVSVPIAIANGNRAAPRSSSSVPVGTVAMYQESAEDKLSETLKADSKMFDCECDKATNLPKLALENCTGKDSVSGPSKRARPVEPMSIRMPSRSSKAKGKASLTSRAGEKAAFTFAASSVVGRGSSVQSGSGAKKARGRVGPPSGTASELNLPTLLDSGAHESAVHRLKQAIQLSDSTVLMDSVRTVDCADTGSLGCTEVIPGVTEGLMESDRAIHCKGLGNVDCSVEMSGVIVGDPPNSAS